MHSMLIMNRDSLTVYLFANPNYHDWCGNVIGVALLGRKEIQM